MAILTYLYVYIGAIEDGYTNLSICLYRSYRGWLY